MPATPTSAAKGAALTRERLMTAGLEAFSASGFNGVSGREIERLAGVERGLLAYHFGTKLKLWEECVDVVYARFTDEMSALSHALRDVSRGERARALLMAYARFSLANPEFFRMLVLEGHARSERSDHLARHLWRGVQIFRDVTGLDGEPTPQDAIQVFQILGAAGALPAITAYLTEDLEAALKEPAVIEAFAQTLAAFAAAQQRLTS